MCEKTEIYVFYRYGPEYLIEGILRNVYCTVTGASQVE